MADSPLWLGVMGGATGVVSFGWNVIAYRRQGPRAKLLLVYGGVVRNSNHGPIAAREPHELKVILRELKLSRDQGHADRLVAGLRVANPGRAPLFVAGVGWRTQGGLRGHNAHLSFEGSPAMPCEIPAGGEATYYVDLAVLNEQLTIAEHLFNGPQWIALEIWNAHKVHRSNAIPPEILALAPPRGRP
jgi:hypothetical protein